MMTSPGIFATPRTGVAGDGGLVPRPRPPGRGEPRLPLFFDDPLRLRQTSREGRWGGAGVPLPHLSVSLSTWLTEGSQRSRRSSPRGKPPAKEPPSNKPLSRPREDALKDKVPATGRVTQASRRPTNEAQVDVKQNDNNRAE